MVNANGQSLTPPPFSRVVLVVPSVAPCGVSLLWHRNLHLHAPGKISCLLLLLFSLTFVGQFRPDNRTTCIYTIKRSMWCDMCVCVCGFFRNSYYLWLYLNDVRAKAKPEPLLAAAMWKVNAGNIRRHASFSFFLSLPPHQ